MSEKKKKATVKELQAILDDAKIRMIEVLPNGEIRVKEVETITKPLLEVKAEFVSNCMCGTYSCECTEMAMAKEINGLRETVGSLRFVLDKNIKAKQKEIVEKGDKIEKLVIRLATLLVAGRDFLKRCDDSKFKILPDLDELRHFRESLGAEEGNDAILLIQIEAKAEAWQHAADMSVGTAEGDFAARAGGLRDQATALREKHQ